MVRKLVSMLLVFFMVIFLFPVSSLLADVSNNDEISFFVEKNTDANLNGTVNIEFIQTEYYPKKLYNGLLFLPSCADLENDNLHLSWIASSNVEVKVNNQVVESSQVPIPAVGESLICSVTTGSNNQISEYKITTMKGSETVEPMFLSVDESYSDEEGSHTIKQMNSDTNHEAKCYGDVFFKDNEYAMSVKGRGNATWSAGLKKPYNITIYSKSDSDNAIEPYGKKEKTEFIEGIKSSKWTLIANFADSTLMKNKIGYDLAQNLGIGIASRYVDVWMNGKYIGLYLMTPKSDYNVADNGYALELDNYAEAEEKSFELKGLYSVCCSKNTITMKKIGDDALEEGINIIDIKSWMQSMLDAVMDSSSDKYTDYIDVDSWAKLYLIQEYCKNLDVICGSILMHRDGLTDSDKLIAGPVWDLDNAWGRTGYANGGIDALVQFSAVGWYIDGIDVEPAFLKYLGQHPDFMERVYEIYNEYYEDFKTVYSEIDNLKEQIKDSANMNFGVWDVNQPNYNNARYNSAITYGEGKYAYNIIPTQTWDDYISNLKSFVKSRFSFMSDNMHIKFPTIGAISGDLAVKAYSEINLMVTGEADKYQWQSSVDGETWENISGATTNIYKATATSDMNGLKVRCLGINEGEKIKTQRVAQANPRAIATSDVVTINVNR